MVPEKIWVQFDRSGAILRDSDPEVKPIGSVLDAYHEYHRAPATLDEALRDYAMFGKFVAKACAYTGREFLRFKTSFIYGALPDEMLSYPEYVSFVKEELNRG